MLSEPFIQQVTIDGRDIQRIVFDRLMPAVESEEFAPVIFSLLMYAIMRMKPDIDMETLQSIVQSTSEHIIMQLTPAETNQLN